MPNAMRHVDARIDAVITWVDGHDPAHRRQRLRYMAQSATPLHANAANSHRWDGSDEILYCLRSIEINAPWIGRIWIVIADTAPRLDTLTPALRARIRLIYHRDLFAGFPDALPTFNSLAIESLLWRIPDLSERYLYFNDDVFLTAPLAPDDVFAGQAPVLRGGWVDLGALPGSAPMRADPALFHHFVQINAARIAGFPPDRVFACAHVVHPMRRSVMAGLFRRHRDRFARNVAYRFRDLGQFLPQGLHNHACIAADAAVINTEEDHLHLHSGIGNDLDPDALRASLVRAARPGIKFLCVNDLPQLEAAFPDARRWILHMIRARPSAKWVQAS